jgi:LacI family transcriptional regulator
VAAPEEAAVQFIREHACRPISVAGVLRRLSVSRASLEPRFRDVLGRTIHQEIHRVRIERARMLLAETDLPIKQIARQTGFKTVQYLTRAFGRLAGEPPAAFRRRQSRRLSGAMLHSLGNKREEPK